MFKIAYCAGHYLGTAGKRLPKALDPAQTREWVLNDRVASAFAQAAKGYPVQLLRTDDETGKTHRSIKKRTAMANAWGADLYIDLHHNAGVNLGSGGGVVAYCDKDDLAGQQFRDAIYRGVIAAGGLVGNRGRPLQEKRYNTMAYAKMPAVLLECGFMDSATDAPVILLESYSKAVGQGIMDGIAQMVDFSKKEVCQVEVKVLKKGAKGAQVKAMQMLLQGNGFSCGSKGVDGSFGAATDKALRAYQKANGLAVDGSCGSKTWQSLLGG